MVRMLHGLSSGIPPVKDTKTWKNHKTCAVETQKTILASLQFIIFPLAPVFFNIVYIYIYPEIVLVITR